MESFPDILIKHTKLPVHLKELLQVEEEVTIVHARKEDVDEDLAENTNVSLNLTGSPLKINLHVPLLNHENGNTILNRRNYIPLSVESARNFLNSQFNGLENLTPKAIYCICDGSDKQKTVLLGTRFSNKFINRTIVLSKDCSSKPSNDCLQDFIKQHISNVGLCSPKVEFYVSNQFDLFGSRLHDVDMSEEIDQSGSITITSSWNVCQFDIPENDATIKLLLQIVTGHEDSILYLFYKQLLTLHNCLNALKQENFNELVISDDVLPQEEIRIKISEVLSEFPSLKLPVVPKGIMDATRSLEEVTLTDKLWRILRQCRSVNDLKDCLIFLFETIKERLRKVQILPDDLLNEIGKILSSIKLGQTGIPYLTSKQCLELLLQLGILKLKAIYFTLMKSCDFNLAQILLKRWNKTGSFVVETDNGMFDGIDLFKTTTQLKLLQDMYVLLEFSQLVECKGCFSQDVTLAAINKAYEKILKGSSNDFTVCRKIFEVVLPLRYQDIELLQSYSLAKWQIKLSTSAKLSKVETIFCYSKEPIFSVFVENSSINDTELEMIEQYYLAVVENYSDMLDL